MGRMCGHDFFNSCSYHLEEGWRRCSEVTTDGLMVISNTWFFKSETSPLLLIRHIDIITHNSRCHSTAAPER